MLGTVLEYFSFRSMHDRSDVDITLQGNSLTSTYWYSRREFDLSSIQLRRLESLDRSICHVCIKKTKRRLLYTKCIITIVTVSVSFVFFRTFRLTICFL